MNNIVKPASTLSPKLIHFGIDYIRLTFAKDFFSPEFDDFFAGLSANSNYREIDWYNFHFTLDYTLQPRLELSLWME